MDKQNFPQGTFEALNFDNATAAQRAVMLHVYGVRTAHAALTDVPFVVWAAHHPNYVNFATHKLTFVDVLGIASGQLRNDPSVRVETLHVGWYLRAIVESLPQFTKSRVVSAKGLLPKEGGKALLGELGRHRVVYDKAKAMDMFGLVTNGEDRVLIGIELTRPAGVPAPVI
jgi:hypothetical protein